MCHLIIPHHHHHILTFLLRIFSIDEAGRGPLAGPVVVAAVVLSTDVEGIVDSKKITKEDDRERLYEEIVAARDVEYAVAVIDAATIDEVNILQATLEGMTVVAQTMIGVKPTLTYTKTTGRQIEIPILDEPTIDHDGCYVVCSQNVRKRHGTAGNDGSNRPRNYHALIDGNKVPTTIPCPADAIVKGDGKEFCIGAASVLAKVTRDRLMRRYDVRYPQYNLQQHKGYPTQEHMSLVKTHGASKIHRRTFAPLKHMDFDENGNIVK
jgi:ribonuclease HII